MRTAFNYLGPITNPAGVTRQLIGVYAPQWVEPMAQRTGGARLRARHGRARPAGHRRALALRRDDGRDRRATAACTISELDARELGIELCALVRPGGRRSAAQRGDHARACSGGERGPARPTRTALNAAATLVVAGRVADLGEGLDVAREALRNRGAAMATLSALRAAGEGPDVSYLDEIGAWTRERLEERRETRSLAASLLEARKQLGDRRGQARLAVAGSDRAGRGPASVAQQYAADGAAAISVLTSGRDFGGSYADLAAVRAVVDLPILCKDFFVDVWQVTEARVHGADAILVLLALVEDALAVDLSQAAEDLEMETIVEVHSGPELERALDLGTPIIGVNARDLATLEIDRARQIELLRRLPRGLLRIAESGIETPDHARAARDAGADALLVGTALMRDPALLPALVRSGA